jgi:hypothetical protein
MGGEYDARKNIPLWSAADGHHPHQVLLSQLLSSLPDADSVGSVQTSDTMLNSIHKIIDRAIQSNLYSVMMDCPSP